VCASHLTEGAYSAPQTSQLHLDSLVRLWRYTNHLLTTYLRWPISKGNEGKGEGRVGKEKEGEVCPQFGSLDRPLEEVREGEKGKEGACPVTSFFSTL